MKHVNEKKSKKGEPKAGIGTRLVDTAAYTALGGCVGGLGGAVAKSLGLLSFLKPVVGLIGSTKLGAVVMAGTGGVLPMAVLGGAGVGGVLWGIAKAFQNFSSNEAAITHKEILAKKLEEIESKLVNTETNQSIKLEFDKLSDDFIKELNKTLSPYHKEQKDKPTIKDITVNAIEITHEQLDQLLNSALGNFGTEILGIQNASHIAPWMMVLSQVIKNGGFSRLNKLDLKESGVDLEKLALLNEIGFNTAIEHLVLSGNNLSTEPPKSFAPLLNFFSNSYRHFPSLKTLELQDAKLHDEELPFIKSLLYPLSSIETLDISGNGFTIQALRDFVNTPDFQSNLSLKQIVTGHNEDEEIKAALLKRETRVKEFIQSAEIEEGPSEKSLPLTLLNRLSSKCEKTERGLSQFLAKVFEDKLDQMQQSAGWGAWAKALEKYKKEGNLTQKEYNDFIRKQAPVEVPDKMTLLLDEKLHNLLEGQEATTDFKVNEAKQQVKINGPQAVSKIAGAFHQLSSVHPNLIIESLSLDDAKLGNEDLITLLQGGIGNFETKTLSLRNNQLTDEAILYLAEIAKNTFIKVKHLDLSGNQLTSAGLAALSKFCKRSGVETLNISENPLEPANAVERKALGDFFGSLSNQIPSLKSLDISHVGLKSDTLKLIEPILHSLSLLESIRFGQKTIKQARAAYNLVSHPLFQANLNIQEVECGFNDVKMVHDELKKREKTIKAFGVAQPVEKRNKALTCLLLDKYQDSPNNPEISEEVALVLKRADQSGRNLESQLKDVALMLTYRGVSQDITESQFITFKLNEPTRFESLLGLKMNVLKNAEDNEILELNLGDEKELSTRKKEVLEQFMKTLAYVDEQGKAPILKLISLKGLNLNGHELDGLVVAGLGNYKTETLDLSNNQLTDEQLISLSKLNNAYFAHLSCLDLSHNNITANGLKFLAEFCRTRGIKKLILNHNPLAPKNSQEEIMIYQFSLNAHRNMPSMEMIDISEVGLQDHHLALLQPLLNQPSLLKAAKITQKGFESAKTIEELVSKPDFKSNLSMTELETGVNHLKHVKKHLLEKEQFLKDITQHIHESERQTPFICMFLGKMAGEKPFALPELYKVMLNQETNHISGAFNSTPVEKLFLMANHLRYVRDRAKVFNPNYKEPSLVSTEEYLALKRNELEKFWSLQNATHVDEPLIKETIEKYHRSIINQQPLKALLLHTYQLDGHVIKVYWGEDNTIRIVNEAAKKQLIKHRYSSAFMLRHGTMSHWEIGAGHALILDSLGTVLIQHREQGKIACIQGAESELYQAQRAMTLRLDLSRFQMVSQLAELCVSPEPVGEPQRGMLLQFERQRKEQASPVAKQNVEKEQANPDLAARQPNL